MIKLTAPHPLFALIKIYFRDRAVVDALTKYEIENSIIEKAVLRTLNEMGIYQVMPGAQHELLREAVLDILLNSKELYQLDQRARYEINLRKSKSKMSG